MYKWNHLALTSSTWGTGHLTWPTFSKPISIQHWYIIRRHNRIYQFSFQYKSRETLSLKQHTVGILSLLISRSFYSLISWTERAAEITGLRNGSPHCCRCVCVCVSGAGRPQVHLFGELQDEVDVGPLVRIWVEAHTDQISELQHIQVSLWNDCWDGLLQNLVSWLPRQKEDIYKH